MSFDSDPTRELPAWDGNLGSVLDRIAQLTTGSSGLRVIAAGSRLALALPKDRAAAALVIDLYRPQRWKGQLFQTFSKLLVSGGFAARFPSYKGSDAGPSVEWLRSASEAGSVGFLGCNPVHGWRCVLAGILPEDGSRFVAKLGFGTAAQGVRREAKVLSAIEGRYAGVVEAVSLAGPNSAVGSGEDWALLRLPYLEGSSPSSMADLGISDLLMAWMGDQENQLGNDPWSSSLLGRVSASQVPLGWLEKLSGMKIRSALMHGDFAVWNLRRLEHETKAIDWEWAREDGIAGVDLAHALRQEAVMVRGMNPGDAVSWILEFSRRNEWSRYLDAAGWGCHHEDWLRLGLMHSHFHTMNDSAGLLAVLGIKVSSDA